MEDLPVKGNAVKQRKERDGVNEVSAEIEIAETRQESNETLGKKA